MAEQKQNKKSLSEELNFSRPIFDEHRNKTNRTFSRILRISAAFMVLIIVLNLVGVFKIAWPIYPVLFFSIFILLLPTIFYDFLKYDSPALHYLFLTILALMSGLLYAFLSYHVILMIVFPVIVSILYYDKKSVIYISVIEVPIIVVSHYVAFLLKIVPDEPLVTLKGVFLYGVLPRLLEYIIFMAIGLVITSRFQAIIKRVVEKNEELYVSQENTIESLAELVEYRSQHTGNHIKRVSKYTRVLCDAAGFPIETSWLVSVASMMHDVGKLILNPDILNKPGSLDVDEFDEIKKHTQYGKDLLKNSKGEILEIASVIAEQHHERYDGKGYMGLKGEEINIYARIVAIADVFDALASKRPYKEAWGMEQAYEEIVSQAGKQFDPNLVELFKTNFDKFVDIYNEYKDENFNQK